MPRPAKAAALLRPVATLHGVGPTLAARLALLLGCDAPTLLDLLAHLPRALLDPTPLLSLGEGDDGRPATVEVEVLGHRPRGNRQQPYRVQARGAGGRIELVFFGAKAEHLAARYLFEARYRLHGVLRRVGGSWQMAHPEPLDAAVIRPLPIYPSTAGLTQRTLRTAVGRAVAQLTRSPEWADARLIEREGWPAFAAALAAVHAPDTASALEPEAPARRRLAYDELLATQLGLALMRRRRHRRPGRALPRSTLLLSRLLAGLPFTPTAGQLVAMAEVAADLARPVATTRLLQGDVGSGKTLVALAAMLQAAEAGMQAAMLAPTEVLARQHHAVIGRLVAPLGLEVDLLIGREPAARRHRSLARLASGEARLVVGTHALLQSAVEFADLGVAVIDEQHRFGVGQRLAMTRHGPGIDLLLTTATPIPRSAVLAAYGDLPVSILRDRPAGRRPVATKVVSVARYDELVERLRAALDDGERVFWVCPLVEEGVDGDAAAAIARHAALARDFGPQVGLIHGRMRGAEKDAALASFRAGTTPLLVATTVIEVGVDVPEAGVMVVEEAQRFGLAQLHQLRGRVGRGDRPGHAILLYTPPLGANARARLALLRTTDDGFLLAEEDLRQRGPGDVLGMRQSGLPAFRFVDLAAHADLLPMAHDDAALALANDPTLAGPRGGALRLLLELFRRDDGVFALAAG